MVRGRRWTDDDVINMAVAYLADATNSVMAVEQQTGIPDATVWWCINNRLKWIDGGLYLQCLYQISKHRGRRR